MRQLLVAVVIALVAVGAGAAWYFHGREYVVRLDQAALDARLRERFPFSESLLILRADFTNPRVQLTDGSSRVAMGFDVALNVTVEREPRTLGGKVDVDAGIRYEPADGTFHLDDPVVQRLDVDGVPERYREVAKRLVTKAFREFVETRPVHTLHAFDVKQATARLLLKSVVVEHGELVITLGI